MYYVAGIFLNNYFNNSHNFSAFLPLITFEPRGKDHQTWKKGLGLKGLKRQRSSRNTQEPQLTSVPTHTTNPANPSRFDDESAQLTPSRVQHSADLHIPPANQPVISDPTAEKLLINSSNTYNGI